MKKIFASVFAFVTMTMPMIIWAAEPKNFKELINNVFIDGLIRPLVPLLIGLAVVIFVYGVITLMFSEGGEKKEEGKEYMFWGIIGIFVMVSVWGLVNVLKGTFGLSDQAIQFQIRP